MSFAICFGAIVAPITVIVRAEDDELIQTTDESAETSESSVTSDSEPFDVAAKAAIAIDPVSGKIFYAKNVDEAMGIASITKTITAYLTLEAIKNGTLHWDDKIMMSDYAYELTQNPEASNIAVMNKDETFTIRDLFNAAMIQSANSAAITLAETIGGSEPKFVDMMKAKLTYWGISDAKLVNATGLSNSVLGENIYPGSAETDENQLSAKDVAIIAQHLISDFPEILETTKKTEAIFDEGGESEQELTTYNYMLPTLPAARDGVDGLKTGTTEFAGACFVATTIQNDFRIITVVLNAENAENDDYARFSETSGLMNYVYGNWKTQDIALKGVKMANHGAPNKLTVLDGNQKSVEVLPAENFSAVVPMLDMDTKTTIAFNKKQNANVTAAIKKGQKLVRVTFSIKDDLGYLPNHDGETFYLTATTSVKRSNAIKVMWNHFVKFINDKL
ncbi:D-alanyl-D-alanine carboxypeptidase [Lactococcus hodotermopsidis]|uniref:serine-type D-Ala-D-Ala carboxypeptidase n=2 Tax=Pseudolactococcus hodotermopsidis TaxID=2709157 RepID=A0A6A0B8A8_9LACT|nr:D-alanyl-D-alanine carboxypeptidase [Lactococcus hodotermopsidis]